MTNLIKSIAVMAVSALLLGCADPLDQYTSNKFHQSAAFSGGFSDSERITPDGSHIGNTLDGTKYAYFEMSDRRGLRASLINQGTEKYERYMYFAMSSGDWGLHCEENPMTDRMSCRLTYNTSVRLIGSSPTQLSTLCLVDHDFPGRSASIRINGGSVINLGEDGCKRSSTLVDDFLSADSVSISFVRWPYDSRVNFSLRDYKTTNVNEFLSFASGIF